MIDTALRHHKEHVLRPLAAKVAGVPPLTITLVAFATGLAAAGAAACGLCLAALGLWLLNRLLDGLDGSVARLLGKQSDLGGYLDILLDFAVYALIPIALVVAFPSEAAYLALALLLASFYVNGSSWMYLSALLEKRGRRNPRYTSAAIPGGLIEGGETILFYCFFLLFPETFVPLALVMAALVMFTAGQRVVWAVRNLS